MKRVTGKYCIVFSFIKSYGCQNAAIYNTSRYGLQGQCYTGRRATYDSNVGDKASIGIRRCPSTSVKRESSCYL